MADAPAFDPSKPYEVVSAPAFDPSKPYEDATVQQPKRESTGSATDYARAAATGVPIIGGLLNKADAATNAALAPLIDQFLPDSYEKLPGKTWSERYDQALAIQKRRDAEFAKGHPVANTAAELAGGLASTGGLAATAIGARALGLGGTTLPGQIARGFGSNLVIGGLDAATRGGDPITGAAIGGVVGAAAPPIGRAVSAAVQPVATTLRGILDPAGEAARRVATALNRDIGAGAGGLVPAEFAAARQSGVPVNLMDVGGETTRAVARSAANTAPEARAVLDRAVNDRFEGQANRLTDWLNQMFHYPNATAQRQALDETARTANRQAYFRAYRDGAGSVWSPELERLAGSDTVASAMRRAAAAAGDESIINQYGAMNPRVRFTADGRMEVARGQGGVPAYPDLQFWDLTRREISGAANAARRSGNDTEARRLDSFARALNGELDRIVPSYQTARAGAAASFGAENALEAGQNFVTSKLGNREARAALARMSPQERQLFQDGFVDRYTQMIRESPDRRSVLNQIATSPAARERLAIAVGPQRAQELEAFLHVERIMDLSRPAVQGNSTTARQLAELGLAGGAYGLSGGDWTSPDRLMNAALVYGAARGQRVIDGRVAQHVARLLTSNDLTQVNRAIRMIAGSRGLLDALRMSDNASILARAATPTALAPLAMP